MKYKILIIDDEEMILSMMEKCLKEKFSVYTVNNAKSVGIIEWKKSNTRYHIVGYQYARNGWIGIMPAYTKPYILSYYFFGTCNRTGCDKRIVCRRR